ncbi:hypothetical protein [Caulobacter sp. Root655]|uniref:hypothetical protein n=1 Tax=Caulobacter sp. Root655 TaxID=1736578 RepID=UPI0012E395AF|nr:hypothetical protein [Caulobacter sp. Root655]
MHLSLFLKWIWERICDANGAWPWAEANQGLLSSAALGLGFFAIWYESRRANFAEAKAKEAARDLERRERQALRVEKSRRARAYLKACEALVIRVEIAIETEEALVQYRLNESPNVQHMCSLQQDTIHASQIVHQSLIALFPTAPLDPAIIISAQKAANVAAACSGQGTTSCTAPQMLKWLRARLADLQDVRRELRQWEEMMGEQELASAA